jgi:hypothetical protein
MARRRRQRFKVTIFVPGNPKHPQPYSCEVEAWDANGAASEAAIKDPNYYSSCKPLPYISAPKVGVLYEASKQVQVSLTVENLGAVPRHKYTAEERAQKIAKRDAERKAREEAEERRKEEQRRRVIAVRQRIVNQIELAFEKKMKTATEFVTCEHCNEKATQIIVQRTPEGSAVPFEDIVSARCADHAKWFHRLCKGDPFVDCDRVEFFYDGLRQLHVNKPQ